MSTHISSNLGVFHQHVLAGNAHIGELDPAVVDTLTTELLAAVTNVDARQQCEGLRVAELDQEDVHAVVLFTDEQARKADSVRGSLGSATNPPLSCGQSRRVDHKLLALLIVGSSGLETLDVTAVTELSHGEAASDFHSLHVILVLGDLFFGAVAFNGAFEKTVVNTNTSIDARIDQTDKLRAHIDGFTIAGFLCVIFKSTDNFLHSALTCLVAAVVVVVVGLKDRISFEFAHETVLHLSFVNTTFQIYIQFVDIKSSLRTLLGEGGGV
jgi:hypothetical protein